MLLLEPLNAVDRLDEVVELEADASEDFAVAMTLEVAARPGNDRLGAQEPIASVAEVNNALFSLFEVLAAPYAHHIRDGLLNGVTLGFEVMPDHKVVIRRSVDQLGNLGDTRRQAVALLCRRSTQAQGGVLKHQRLPISICTGFGVVGRHLVIDHIHLRQVIAVIAVTQIARVLDEHGPARNPEPELFFLVRVEGQVSGFLAVALEEPRQGLPGIHDTKESSVVDQLFEPVGARHCRVHQLEFDRLKQWQELLVGLASVASQNACFVQTHSAKDGRVQLAVAHRFIVCDVKQVALGHLGFCADEAQFDAEHGGVADQFLTHAERAHNQAGALDGIHDLAQPFALHHRLAQAKLGEDGTVATLHGPTNDIALVRKQDGA